MNLNQVTVPVSDLEKSIAFYEKLGLQLIVRSWPDYARFVCKDGNTTFSLHKVEKRPAGEGIWVYFEVQDIDKYVNDLIDKGIVFEEMPEDKPWLWRESRLKDPDSNQIIIYFAAENRINPPWKIS